MSDDSATKKYTSEQLRNLREKIDAELGAREQTPEARKEFERKLDHMSDNEFNRFTGQVRNG